MSTTICVVANSLYYPKGGGHMWVYLNWALGFKSNGCRVIWLEFVYSGQKAEEIQQAVNNLKAKLEVFGLADDLALCDVHGGILPKEKLTGCLNISQAASSSDLLLNQRYTIPSNILKLFRKTVLLDLDPGLLQLWCKNGYVSLLPHTFYFTIGETVGQPNSRIPDIGVSWNYTPPCVSLEAWQGVAATPDAPLTTITHWSMEEWIEEDGETYCNDKRTGYLPFLKVPKHSPVPMELAILLGQWDQKEEDLLKSYGWHVSNSHIVAATPVKYQQYIQSSFGEFSCVKPSCVRLQNAWISDRTICYFASGKPAIVQHTGASRFLPDRSGLVRFKTVEESIACIKDVMNNYELHCRQARMLAEEYFDAKKVTENMLQIVL